MPRGCHSVRYRLDRIGHTLQRRPTMAEERRLCERVMLLQTFFYPSVLTPRRYATLQILPFKHARENHCVALSADSAILHFARHSHGELTTLRQSRRKFLKHLITTRNLDTQKRESIFDGRRIDARHTHKLAAICLVLCFMLLQQ